MIKTSNDIISGNGRVLKAYVYQVSLGNVKLFQWSNTNKVEFKILTKLGRFDFLDGLVLYDRA